MLDPKTFHDFFGGSKFSGHAGYTKGNAPQIATSLRSSRRRRAQDALVGLPSSRFTQDRLAPLGHRPQGRLAMTRGGGSNRNRRVIPRRNAGQGGVGRAALHHEVAIQLLRCEASVHTRANAGSQRLQRAIGRRMEARTLFPSFPPIPRCPSAPSHTESRTWKGQGWGGTR